LDETISSDLVIGPWRGAGPVGEEGVVIAEVDLEQCRGSINLLPLQHVAVTEHWKFGHHAYIQLHRHLAHDGVAVGGLPVYAYHTF
jgi:hypothetical protein